MNNESMQLLFLLVLILATYALAGLKRDVSRSFRGRLAMTVFFLFTGLGHFFKTEEMAQMLPPFVPERIAIIYVTGVLEILGGIALLIPSLTKYAAWALIIFLIGVLPANVYSALYHVEFGGHASGPLYLILRIPFQLF